MTGGTSSTTPTTSTTAVTPVTPVIEPGTSAASRLVRGIATARETGILLALILVIVAATLSNPNFLFSSDGFRDLLLTPSLLMLVAVGQAVVIITRNVDLSVGSIVGLTAYLTGRLFIDVPGIPIIGVFLAGVLLGGLLGAINGVLVAFARVPALVITLGTMYIYRGINVAWTGSDRINASDLPRDFRGLGTDQFLGIPVLTIIAVVVLIVAGWYLRNLRGGRELYAIGSDPAAAHLYGLKVTPRIITAFVVSGALSGLAGVLYAARYGTVSSQAGFGWELQAIGAAVIGGVAISGGVGTVWGAAIGAFLLLTINRALPILGIDDFWQRAVVGVLIIGAIVLDRVLAVRQHRRLVAQRYRDQGPGDRDPGDQGNSDQKHGDRDHGGQDHGDRDHGGQHHGDQKHGGQDHRDQKHGDQDHGGQDHRDQKHGGQDHRDQKHGDQSPRDQHRRDQGHSGQDHSDQGEEA